MKKPIVNSEKYAKYFEFTAQATKMKCEMNATMWGECKAAK